MISYRWCVYNVHFDYKTKIMCNIGIWYCNLFTFCSITASGAASVPQAHSDLSSRLICCAFAWLGRRGTKKTAEERIGCVKSVPLSCKLQPCIFNFLSTYTVIHWRPIQTRSGSLRLSRAVSGCQKHDEMRTFLMSKLKTLKINSKTKGTESPARMRFFNFTRGVYIAFYANNVAITVCVKSS